MRVARRKTEIARHDADHGVRQGIQDHGAAGDLGVGAEAAAPQCVAEQDGAGGAGPIVLRGEGAAKGGLHAQHGQKAGGDAGAFQPRGIAGLGEIGGEIPPCLDAFEGVGEALPIAEIGGRRIHARVAARGIVFPDLDQAVGIRVGQRAQQDVIGQREGGGGGADAEGGHGDGGESEGGRPAQAARGPDQIAAQDVPVGGEGAGAGVGDGVEPECEYGEGIGCLRAPQREKGAEFGGVLGAEAGGIEVEQRAVEAHQALPRGEAAGAGHADQLRHAARFGFGDRAPERRDAVVAAALVIEFGRGRWRGSTSRPCSSMRCMER